MRNRTGMFWIALGAVGGLVAGCSSSKNSARPNNNGSSAGSGTSGAAGATPSGASGSTAGSSSTKAGGSAGAMGAAGAIAAGGASGNAGSGGSNAGSGAGGSKGTGGATSSAGTTGSSVANTNIPTKCTSALPPGAQPADVSHPTTVVGTGTAASCTFDALNSAVAKAGVITFDCGTAPVTIGVTATLMLSTAKDTVIDGGNTITLDGKNAVQILRFYHDNAMVNETRVTLQHLTLINAKTTPTKVIPTAPPPCSQGYDDGEGGALFMRDGNLTVIDCTFSHNQAAPLGPDTGGGAIYINQSKHGALIVGSVFTDNSASNAGAVGALFAELDIYDSLFKNNTATGNGANDNKASECSAMNNGQNEVGSGGNGGAIYQDGQGTNVVLCGDDIENNAAGMGAFGGGVFMTSNDYSGTMTVRDSTITGNTGGHWTICKSGSVMDLGTAFGINAKSATVENSTLQGL